MKKLSLIILILSSLWAFCPVSCSEESSDSLVAAKPDFDQVFSDALRCIKMTPEDLRFRDDYVDVDSFRLSLIDRLMRKPMETISFNSTILSNWRDATSEEKKFLMPFVLCRYLRARGEPDWPETWKRHIRWREIKSTEYVKLEGLPEPLKDCLLRLTYGIGSADRRTQGAMAELNEEEMVFLRTNFPLVLLEDVNDEFKSPEELDREAEQEEKLAEEMIPYLAKIDQSKLCRAGEILAHATASCILLLGSYLDTISQVTPVVKDSKDRENDLIFRKELFPGEVVIGGFGSSRYSGSPAIIIDLGGDDEYSIMAGQDNADGFSVIIDLGGNDLYRAEDNFAYGSGFFGTGILVDLSGDDTYLTRNFSLGSGLFGVGVLVDEQGNDRYFGDTFCQGAGSFGMGFLVDMQGSDQYSAALYAQGFGFVSGMGALIDSSGNDNYFAGGRYKDILRYKDHYISLSQGFAYGLRPMMSGGIGMLFDLSGNDVYTSDIFGQGSSYWFSLGTLLDAAGNDKYVSFQYAQGAGTHLTLGILEDEAGDDVYISHGVSQGCGHDLALGMLWDKSGHDNYVSESLSQGAGSANGFGILADESGDDGYYIQVKSNTQGYGNPRRDYGSVGMLLDFSGKDQYNGNGKDSTWWTTPSKWGVGVDR